MSRDAKDARAYSGGRGGDHSATVAAAMTETLPQERMNRSRLAVLAFMALWIVAMASYPGWNAFDSTSTGHDFLRNFLCDILSATTPDGRSNVVGAVAMNTGVLVLVAGALLPLWWHAPVRHPWQIAGRMLGGGAALLTLAICVEQAFALPLSHNVVTLTAGAAGLVPTFAVAAADWRSPDSTPTRRALLIGTLVASLANFVSYALVQLGGTLTPFVPAAQKVALVCLVGWLFLVPTRRQATSRSKSV